MATPIKRPTLFVFDPRTQEFLGQREAEVCQESLKRDMLDFLYAAFRTAQAPPDAPRGSVMVWRGDHWEPVEDHRGETWWQAHKPVTICDLGDPADHGLTAEPPKQEEPPPPDPVALRKGELLAKLQEITTLGASYVAIKQPVPSHIVAAHAEIADELTKLQATAKQ